MPFLFVTPVAFFMIVLIIYIFIEDIKKIFNSMKSFCIRLRRNSESNMQIIYSVNNNNDNSSDGPPINYDQLIILKKDEKKIKKLIKTEDQLPTYSEFLKSKVNLPV